MIDTINLNPTEFILLIMICYSVGFLSSVAANKVKSILNKYYYIK
jgi:hypothetical protein